MTRNTGVRAVMSEVTITTTAQGAAYPSHSAGSLHGHGAAPKKRSKTAVRHYLDTEAGEDDDDEEEEEEEEQEDNDEDIGDNGDEYDEDLPSSVHRGQPLSVLSVDEMRQLAAGFHARYGASNFPSLEDTGTATNDSQESGNPFHLVAALAGSQLGRFWVVKVASAESFFNAMLTNLKSDEFMTDVVFPARLSPLFECMSDIMYIRTGCSTTAHEVKKQLDAMCSPLFQHNGIITYGVCSVHQAQADEVKYFFELRNTLMPRKKKSGPSPDQGSQAEGTAPQENDSTRNAPVHLRIGQFVRGTRKTWAQGLYKGDLGIKVADNLKEVEENGGGQTQDLVVFFPRLFYGDRKNKRQARYESSARDRRPCMRLFDRGRAEAAGSISCVTIHDKLGVLYEHNRHRFACGLAILEKTFTSVDISIPATPTEEECIRWLEPAQLLSLLLSTEENALDFQAPFLEVLRKIRMLQVLNDQETVAVALLSGPCAGLTGWVWEWNSEQELAAVANSSRRVYQVDTPLDSVNHSYDAVTPLSNTFRRFSPGEYVEILRGSDNSGKRAFVVMHPIWSEKPIGSDNPVVMDASVFCLLSDDPNSKEFFEKILGWERPQIEPEDPAIVQVAPWHLKIIDKVFHTHPPTYQLFSEPNKEAVLNGLQSMVPFTESREIESLLANFRCNLTNLRSFLESVSAITMTTKQHMNRKGAKWMWMNHRRVRIQGVGTKLEKARYQESDGVTIDVYHINEHKNHEGEVIGVNGKTCTVAVTSGNAIGVRQEIHVPFEHLVDLRIGAKLSVIEARRPRGTKAEIEEWLKREEELNAPPVQLERANTPPIPPEEYDESWDAHYLPPLPPAPIPPLDQLRSTSPQFNTGTLVYSPASFENCDWAFLGNLPLTIPQCPPILIGVNDKGFHHIEYNVYPGRTGWLVGISDDLKTAQVLFRRNGYKYEIPFEYLTNGPPKGPQDKVLFHTGPNRGKIGYIRLRQGRSKGKVALSSEQRKIQAIGIDLPEVEFMRDCVKLVHGVDVVPG